MITGLQQEYMVLDEPTSRLKPKSRKEVMETLLRLQQQESWKCKKLTIA
jgi:energy-coupling factor transporter ATP-binding protein EcfA2